MRTQVGSGIRAALKIAVDVFRSDIIFSWFASVYSAVGVMIGKMIGVKSIIVIGGVDVAREKDLEYGIWLTPWKAVLVKYALRNADLILAVDPCLREEAMKLAEYDGKNIVYLPTGYNTSFWRPMGEKEPFIMTVALAQDRRRVRLKGIDVFIEAARKMENLSFLIIGIVPQIARELNLPSNVTSLAPLERKELLPYYRRAKVYCQPSRREGLPNTLCEAMSCECIPVATDVGGNRTAVGDAGILVPYGEVEELCAALKEAVTMDEHIGTRARTRIVTLFSKEKREVELLRLIESLSS